MLAPASIMEVVGNALGLEEGWETQRRHNVGRAVAAMMLCKYGGLRQRAAAPILGVGTGAAVSAQLGRLEKALKMDPALASRADHIEGVLRGLRQKAKIS